MQGQQRVRPAAVAGKFYPHSPDQLRTTIEEFLAKAAPVDVKVPKALIVPHAGYIYSGAVAAAAFAPLRQHADAIGRAVLIGPAHYIPFHGLALPTAEAFETPLGRVPVVRDAVSALEDFASVACVDAPHGPEHALEVELPFLQSVLPSFELVPLLVGAATPEEVAEILDRLWGGPETLIVVSSDLSHFHDSETAQRLDAITADCIERGDWASLGPNNACGFLAVAGLLIEASRHGLRPHCLALSNSGDTVGPRNQVVGYGAWIFDSGRDAH